MPRRAESPDAPAVADILINSRREDDWVDQLYVDSSATGQGLGSELIELAKTLRPDGLQLWTFATNIGAQRFYRRHGFVVAETTDGAGNEEKAPDIRFIWPS
jgi:ribosomal protein S18 acetylase RimI-like enzyme